MAVPVPPNKRRLVDIDRSLVQSGVLNEGIPCIPITLVRYNKGERVETVAQSRKFPLFDIQNGLLKAHEKCMRLHTDVEIKAMSKEYILGVLRKGAGYFMNQFENLSLEELKHLLSKYERTRTIWIWHDHSSLASHGILAIMVGVMYDPIVFMTENEIGKNVEEFLQEGEIHAVAHGSSSLQDQATLIPERLSELDGLSDEVLSSTGIRITDRLRFFKGDKPACSTI